MIKRLSTQPIKEGTREYNLFYEVCPDIKIPGAIFTPYRAHHFIRKFQIVRQSGPASLDKRASYSKSYQMRGWKGHKFWYIGKAGLPSVTVDIKPRSLIIYVDKGQKIAAQTAEEAKQIGWYAIYAARDKFLEEQERFNVVIETDRAGQQIGKIHMGLEGSEDGPMAPIKQAQDFISKERVMGVKHPVWFDESPGNGKLELEMFEDHPLLTPAEETINSIGKLPEMIKAAMPEAMKEINEKLNPMSDSMIQVKAMLQGSITTAQQNDNILKFLSKIMAEMQSIRVENQQLKTKLGM